MTETIGRTGGCVEEFSADPYFSDTCGSEVTCTRCVSCTAHCRCERKPDLERARALTAKLIADLRLLQKTPAGQRYNVMARVSGGVTGTRESLCKSNGEVIVFEDQEAAQSYASGLNESMNNAHSVADFRYSVVEGGVWDR